MEMHLKKFHYFNIEFIAISQEFLPKSNIGVFAFFLFKFIGLTIFSNSFELLNDNPSNVSLCYFFRSITYFGSMKRDNLTLVHYEQSLPFIYIILLLPLIIYLILFFNYPSSSSNYSINPEGKAAHITFTKTYKSLTKIATFLVTILMFLSQHLIEYLLFSIMILQIDNIIDSELKMKINAIKSGLNVNAIIILVVNSLFTILLNLYIWFFLKYFNRPFLSKHFIHKFTFNDYFLYLLLIIFNFQGFHFLIHTGIAAKTIFAILSLGLSILLVLFALNRFIEKTQYNIILLSYIYFSIYSSILSLIIHFTIENVQDITNEILLDKFIIEVVFVLVTHYVLMNVQDAILNKVIKENILIKTKNIKGDYLFRLTDILMGCMNDAKQFSLLFYLLENNQSKITKSNLLGEDRLNLAGYIDKLKQEHKSELNIESKHIIFKEKYNNILVLIESEIISHVFNLFCNKTIAEEIRIPLLHCDFISYFKLNYSFSLYLIQEYLSKIPKLPFESIVYFYSLKQFILNERENKIQQNNNNKSLHVKFVGFINYFEILQDIKSHLITNCTNYQQIISLKNVYSEMKTSQVSLQFNTDLEVLFENCMKIEKSMHKMEDIIIENFKNNSLKNPEIVFLITNFYEIIQNHVPDNIQDNMIGINSYDDITQFDSSFLDQGFEHPMILTLSSANSFDNRNVKLQSNFIIYYVSQKLMNALGYKESELIGQDYHILLPRIFAEAHSIELRKVFFINENFQLNKSQFILSKEGYYVKIRETSGMIPSLQNDTIVIVNIAVDLIDENSFLFITDINSNIVTISKNFETTFQLTYEMIKRLGITFSGLFNLNNEKILSNFNEVIKSITLINMDSLNSLMSIKTNNTYENILSAYQKNENKDEVFTIRLNKRKKKLCFCLQKIRKQIEEQEYDTDWVARIATFEKLCSFDKCESSFDIVIALKKVGNIPYFFIKVNDKDHLNPNEQMTKLSAINKMTCINELTPEDYTKKYNESYRKSSFNHSLMRKGLKMKDSISHNVSNNLNETNHQLLSINKKMKPYNSKSLISKLNINSEKEIQKNNELIHSLKQRETYCSLALFVLMTGMSICFIINFFLKNTDIQAIQDSSNLIFNIVKLKESVLESAILVTSGCYQLDNLEPNPYNNVDFTPEMIKSQIYVRASEMYKFYNEFNEYLKGYSNIKEINNQLLTLQLNLTVSNLNTNFTAQTYETSFETSLNYFHFHCGFMKTSNSLVHCNIRDNFLGGVSNEHNDIAEEDEIFFYYTTYNIIIGFMTTIDQLINQSSLYIISNTKTINQRFLNFNVSMLVIALSLLFAYICLIAIYKQRIVSYLKVFIVKSENTIIIEKKLKNFSTILISVDNEVYELYEINKEKLNSYKSNEKDKNQLASQTKRKSKLNSTNGITKSNKTDKEKTKEQDYYQDEHFDANTMRVFSLKILRKALFLFLFSLFISMSVIIGNIVFDTSLFGDVLLSCETAFSYLDHTASLNELLLYYRVSILYRNANFITLPVSDFDSMMYQYQLATAKINMENDQRYTLLGESKMAFLYYRSTYESSVISYFESNNNMKILPLLKQYIKLIDTDGIACEQFSSSYTQYVNDYEDSLDQELLMHACMSLEGGNSNKGIQKQIDHFYTSVFDQYIDFAKEPEGDLVAYSQASAFISCLKLMTFIYNVSWHVCVKIVSREMKDLFNRVRMLEIIFQIIELVMNICFCALFLSFILGYLKLSIDRYGIIIERLKNTLN